MPAELMDRITRADYEQEIEVALRSILRKRSSAHCGSCRAWTRP